MTTPAGKTVIGDSVGTFTVDCKSPSGDSIKLTGTLRDAVRGGIEFSVQQIENTWTFEEYLRSQETTQEDFLFNPAPRDAIDYAAILIRKAAKVDATVAQKLQEGVAKQKEELSQCKLKGCVCHTPLGTTKWINEFITKRPHLLTKEQPLQLDKLGIKLLLARTDLSADAQNKYAELLSIFSMEIDDVTKADKIEPTEEKLPAFDQA